MPISMNNTTLTFNNGTTMTTAATGTVSSVATGNGLQGGTITSTGTLSVACPAFNTVGSYVMGGSFIGNNDNTLNSGSNYPAGGGPNQIRSASILSSLDPVGAYVTASSNLSGTWKFMGASGSTNYYTIAICCRVS